MTKASVVQSWTSPLVTTVCQYILNKCVHVHVDMNIKIAAGEIVFRLTYLFDILYAISNDNSLDAQDGTGELLGCH